VEDSAGPVGSVGTEEGICEESGGLLPGFLVRFGGPNRPPPPPRGGGQDFTGTQGGEGVRTPPPKLGGWSGVPPPPPGAFLGSQKPLGGPRAGRKGSL